VSFGIIRKSARVAAAMAVAAAAWAPAPAKVLLSQEEALKLAFAGAPAERRTAYLTDDEAARAAAAAGSELPSRVVVYYTGGADPNAPELAFFDTHLVRTLPETVMIVVEASGKVRRVDILSFDEPVDYLPSPRWLEQFAGRPLSDDVETGRGIRAVTGATLSSKAITAAVRRALALHSILPAPGGGGTGR